MNYAIETRPLTDLPAIKRIYDTRMTRDFPPGELRPWASLRRSWDRGEYDGRGLFGDGELLGYAFFVRLPTDGGYHYLFDYLAIAQEHRDEGLGTVFLDRLARDVPDAVCMIGEVEDPDMAADDAARALRERRIRFYARSGYRDTGVRSRVFGVDYRILEIPTGPAHSAAEVRSIYAELYAAILPQRILKEQFLLR